MNTNLYYTFLVIIVLISVPYCQNDEEINWDDVKNGLLSDEIAPEIIEEILTEANEKNQYEEIVSLFSEDIADRYFTAKTLNELGVAHYHKGDVGVAVDYFERSIEMDENYGEPFANLGVIFRTKGRFDKAREYYEKALELMEPSPELYFNLGVLYNRLEDFEQEEEMYRKAIEVDENYAPAYQRLARLLIESDRYSDALNVVRRYSQLENSPEEVQSLIKDLSKKMKVESETEEVK